MFSYILSQAKSVVQQHMIFVDPRHHPPLRHRPVGTISEHAIQWYLAGRARFARKFTHTIRDIEKQRLEIERASCDTNQYISACSTTSTTSRRARRARAGPSQGARRGRASAAQQHPYVSQTAKVLKLASVADKAVLMSERSLSTNIFWSAIVAAERRQGLGVHR